MITKLFAVRDGKVEQFYPPMVFQKRGEAQRWFSDVVNDGKSAMWKHPGDFALYEIGEYDSEEASLKGMTVSLVCTGQDVKDSDVLPIREVSNG